MPSKLNAVLANVVTKVAAVTGVDACESTPLDATEWLEGYKSTGGRSTVSHVGLRDTPEVDAYSTDSTVSEGLPVRITVIRPNYEMGWSDFATLKDAIIDAVFATSNLGQGGNAETTDLVGWEIDENDPRFVVFHIDLDVQTLWERA